MQYWKQVLLILLAACSVRAESFKIAAVDMERVVREYYKTKIVESNLKRQADIYQDYAKKVAESLDKQQREFISLRDASQNVVLSDAARESKRLAAQDKYRECLAKKQELDTYNREKRAQLRDDRDRERAKVLEDIRKTIEAHASLAGFSAVFDRSAVSATGLPVMPYASNVIDITDKIIKELNTGRNNRK